MKAKILDVQKTFGGRFRITLEADEAPEDFDSKSEMEVSFNKPKKKRTLDQNALFWACIGEMAPVLNIGTQELALKMVHEYGVFEVVAIPTEAVQSFSRMWKDYEVINQKGKTSWLKCYYGTSKLSKEEFARLIQGVMTEARDADIHLRHGKDVEAWIQSFHRTRNALCAKEA